MQNTVFHCTGRAVASVMATSLSLWMLPAVAEGEKSTETSSLPVYAITETTSSGIDLLSMADQYRTDSLQWKNSSAVLSGPVTHSPVTIENPFILTGSYSGTFYHNTGLANIPLRISLGGSNIKMTHRLNAVSGGSYTNAPGFAHLEIERGGFTTTTYRQWGDENGPRELIVTNGCAFSPWSTYIGLANYSAVLTVDGCATLGMAMLKMETLTDETPSVVSVKNADINLIGEWGASGLFYLSESGTASDAPTVGDCNRVILGEGGKIRAKRFSRKGGARGSIIFRGGFLQHLWSVPGFNNSSVNYSYFLENSGQGTLEFKADTSPISIDVMTNTIVFLNVTASEQATTLFSGTHGFKKLGTGRLTLNNPKDKIVCTLTGGVTVDEGTLALGADSFFSPEDNLDVADPATFDLNGYAATFASVSGSGQLDSSVSGGALTVGGDNADSTFKLTLGSGAKLVKEGTGTMTLLESSHEGDLTVKAGTVAFTANRAKGYKHYRFKVDALYGTGREGWETTAMGISEFKLLDGETDVTRRESYIGCNYATNTFFYPSWETPRHVLDGSLETKWYDKRGAWTNIATYADELYIQLNYSKPMYISGYSWATGNDGSPWTGGNNYGRDPSTWRLLASDDGETWTELDKRENMGPYNTRKAWVDTFAVTYPEDRLVHRLGHVVVEEGATLDLRGVKLVCLSFINCGGTVLTDSDDAISLYSEEGDDVAVLADNASYTGDLTKIGAGTNTLIGTWAVDGNVMVSEGTLRCLAAGFSGKYFRLSIMARKWDAGNKYYMQFAEFYLYGEEGTILDDGRPYKYADSGTDPSTLAESTVSLKKAYTGSPYTTERIDAGFDGYIYKGSSASKYLCLQEPTEEEPIVIHFRAASDTPAVFGYNFVAANDGGGARHPAWWTLEGSYDGVTWRLLDTQKNPDTPNANSKYNSATGVVTPVYLGAQPYPVAFVGEVSADDAYPFGESAVLSVASGAILDLFTPAMTLAALRIDMEAGAGRIAGGFTPAENGTLYLDNVTDSIKESQSLPLTVDSVLQSDRLNSWTVYVNGEPTECRLRWEDGCLKVYSKQGLILTVR